jgi:hypothetical protein
VTPRETEEYRALRATIGERGTTRVWLALLGLGAWGALTIAASSLTPWPVATLVPLLVLAAAFESVFAMHTGVERIGRYLQVFYEDDESVRAWEHQAMAYGGRFPGTGSDALFAAHFCTATFLNFIPVALANPVPVEYVIVGSMHLLVVGRILQARMQARRQRSVDLERFQQLKAGRPLPR